MEGTPTSRKCYYWSCKSEDFLTLKRANLLLSEKDEENADGEDFIELNKEIRK